ncbi:hypothetical protein HIM_06779 [Hirsutella minnesotensis 3608]|uniref:NAD(P)-binding domain-containing protein n=1 Tax=Hirsutella minnesotensis 3608 TaxID=1043627 RepID=A0A0F7ZIP0_9HYPO|nr:hypothetical protein HIM_06779 [Hirsutella minnesotensis 3608]
MAPIRQGRNIALVGASGNVGQQTLEALSAHKVHNITVIARTESTTEFPAGVTVKKGSFQDNDFLEGALEGQDVLVLQLAAPAMHLQDAFIQAAAKKGVKYVLPTEWGSDPSAPLVEKLPMIRDKRKKRQLIEDLGVSSWIAVVNNLWYDYCLPAGLLGIDVAARKATLWDGGATKTSLSTVRSAGAATAELLGFPDAELARYRNSSFYVSSLHASQGEILESVMRATGSTRADWTITERSLDEVLAEADRLAAESDELGSLMAKFFALHFAEGQGGDFSHKVVDLSGFGIEALDLDAVTEQVVRRLKIATEL